MRTSLSYAPAILLGLAFTACDFSSSPKGSGETAGNPSAGIGDAAGGTQTGEAGQAGTSLTKASDGVLLYDNDFEGEDASCWGNRGASGYAKAACGVWKSIGSAGAGLSGRGYSHSGSKALKVTFSRNEEVGGASLALSADIVNVRAYYMFDAGFDFGQGVKVGRVSSFNEATQLNDIDIILAVRSSGSVNQCGLTDMSDLSFLFNGRPVGYDWGSISGAVRFVRNRWYAVEYQVKLNRPGTGDGWVKLWVDGRLVASKEKLNIRGRGGENVKLNRLRMGGWYSNSANGNSCQNPSQPSTLYIDDVAVGSDYIGP